MTTPLLQTHFAVAVSALSGVLAASGKRVDLFGVLVLGLVTALGGGTIRDLILDRPVFWLSSTEYVLNAASTSTLAFFVIRFANVPQLGLVVADAFGLALFTILGAALALQAETGATNAVVLGVITGVAGGILRDVLVGEIPLVMRAGIYLYATASVVGATAYVILEAYYSANHLNRAIGISTTLAIRLLSIRWKVSLPEFPK